VGVYLAGQWEKRRDRIRWNDWACVQPVQFDYEAKPIARAVRLTGPSTRRGDPVRVLVGGAELEGRILEIAHSTLLVVIGPKPDDALF
jgi:hypothetical protein